MIKACFLCIGAPAPGPHAQCHPPSVLQHLPQCGAYPTNGGLPCLLSFQNVWILTSTGNSDAGGHFVLYFPLPLVYIKDSTVETRYPADR